jgi:hypothetical protein
MNSLRWTRGESDLQRIRFLDWVYDNTRGGTLPSGRTYMEETGIGDATLEALVAHASERGLLQVHGGGGMGGPGASSVRLTDAGVTEVLERRERRQDRRARTAACRDAVLDWMYEQRLIGTNNPDAPEGIARAGINPR